MTQTTSFQEMTADEINALSASARFDYLVARCRAIYALLGTRTGSKLHAGYPSGSFMFCGARVASVKEFTSVADRVLCEKCFPAGSPMRAAFVDEPLVLSSDGDTVDVEIGAGSTCASDPSRCVSGETGACETHAFTGDDEIDAELRDEHDDAFAVSLRIERETDDSEMHALDCRCPLHVTIGHGNREATTDEIVAHNTAMDAMLAADPSTLDPYTRARLYGIAPDDQTDTNETLALAAAERVDAENRRRALIGDARTYTANRTNAAAAYLERRETVLDLLAEIRTALDEHQISAAGDVKNWGYVGDLGAYGAELANVLESVARLAE